MRKLFILIIIFFKISFISANQHFIKYNNTIIECKGKNCDFDTLYVNKHPNATDSIILTKVVHGISQSIAVKNPIVKGFLQNEWFLSSFVAFILFIWRKIELRRMRRKGILIDKIFE